MNSHICHEGIVTAVESETVYVKIVQKSACAGCHAKGVCASSDMSEKIIEVQQNNHGFSVGENVILEGETSIGGQAVLLAFVLPFILVIGFLAISLVIFKNEIVSAIISVAVLVPYYGVLYLQSDALKKRFSFKIKHKLNLNL